MKPRRALVTFAWLAACAQAPAESSEPVLDVPDAVEIDDFPASEEALFAELAPMPLGPVQIDYVVTGPGGMEGSMRVTAAEGARRSETWSLRMPLPGSSPVAIEGASIQTPQVAWTDAVEGSAELLSMPLGQLAGGFFELEVPQQRAIVRHVRRWHEEVAHARQAHPGSIDAVAGRTCLRTQTAGQSLCVWEETGLPLEYRSQAFTLIATEVRVGVELGEGAFEIPAGAQLKTDGVRAYDVDTSLKKLAAGDLAELPSFLQPRLGLMES